MRVFIISDTYFENGFPYEDNVYVHETEEGCKKHFQELVAKSKKECYWIEDLKQDAENSNLSSFDEYEDKEDYFNATMGGKGTCVQISWTITDLLD